MPLVSVIVITHNRKHLVKEAIDSVLNQTFTDYELIVVDDGSTDGTADFVEQNYGGVLKVLRRPNGGPAAARNFGAAAASGSLLAFLDDDDVYTPTKLDAQVALFAAEDESLGIVGGGTHYMDIDGNLQGLPQLGLREVTHEHCCIIPSLPGIFSSVMTRKATWESVGGMDPDLRRAQDMDFVIRASKSWRVMNVPIVVVNTRAHDTPRVNVNFDVIYRCREKIISRIESPRIRRKARAWLYFSFFLRCWRARQPVRATTFLVKSFFVWPFYLAPGAERAKTLVNLLLRR